MAQYVFADAAPMSRPVDGKNDGTGTTRVSCHYRLTVTNGASAKLGTFIPTTAVMPSYTPLGKPTSGPTFPKAIGLVVETADSANPVYFNVDNRAASVTDGLRVPVEPSPAVRIPMPEAIARNEIYLFNSGGGDSHVQVFFEWGE